MRSGRGRGHRTSLAVYRMLLLLLPRDFRASYGAAMVQTFSDLLRAERVRRGRIGVLRIWLRAVTQTVSAAVAERLPTGGHDPRDPGDGRSRGIGWVESLAGALRQARRSIAGRRGFAVTVVLVLGIGIGASTTIFTAVNGVLLSEMPFPEIDRLVYFDQASHSPDEYLAWQELDAFEEIAALQARSRDVFAEGVPDRVRANEVTPSYFHLLGVRSGRGRLIGDADVATQAQVAVLSHGYWTERYGADPGVVGESVYLDDVPHTIIGVANEFDPPLRLNRGRPDVWTPLRVAPRQRGNLRVFALRRTEVGATEAQAQVQAAVDELVTTYPEDYRYLRGSPRRVPLVSMRASEVVDVEIGMYMLLAAVGLMFLIACATVANLFLAQARDRRHEIAVRAALGASRRTLAGQLLAESVVLAGMGGLLGIGLAFLGVEGVLAILPAEMPRLETIRIDPAVLAFAAVLSLASGVAFGLAPLLFTERLEDGAARAQDPEGTRSGRAWVRVRGLMVSTQIALALVLLISSGLLANSLVRLLRVDPGFEPESVVAAAIDAGRRHPSGEERRRLAQEIHQSLIASPGVEAAAYGLLAPFSRESGCCWWGDATTPGRPDTVRVHLNLASSGFMETLGIPIVRGTDLPDRELTVGEAVPVIVGTSVERRLFGGANALGRTLRISNGGPEEARVVGVVEDLRYGDLGVRTEPQVFIPYEAGAELHGAITFVAKLSQAAHPAEVMRPAIWGADPELPVPAVLSLREQIDRSVTGQRILSGFLLGFAVFALTIAVIGTYGTMRYAVGRRQKELGVRLVLGASPRLLVSHVMRQGVVVVGLGVIVGLAGAFLVGPVMASAVFGITPWDPATYVVVTSVIATAGMLACYVPARRASRVDPMRTMRAD